MEAVSSFSLLSLGLLCELFNFLLWVSYMLALIFNGITPLTLYFAMKVKIIFFKNSVSQNKFLNNQVVVRVPTLFSYWTLNVSQRASCEITLVRLSVCPSLKISQDWMISFFWFLHDDTLPWYLVTDEARFLKKFLTEWIWAQWT